MRNRYPGRRAVNTPLCDGLHRSRGVGCAVALAGTSEQGHCQVRMDSRVLSAFPGNGRGWPSANSSSARLGRNQLAPVLPWNSVYLSIRSDAVLIL